MEATRNYNIIIIIWLFIALTAIFLLASVMHTSHTAAPVNWQSDTSWVKSW